MNYAPDDYPDCPQIDPHGCDIAVIEWLKAGPYRRIMHRHNGTFRAYDESLWKFVTADTIPLLADALMNWPEHGIVDPDPPASKMYQELAAYVSAQEITQDNIGTIRRSLFMPFDCEWNGWVRDLTAANERSR